MATKTYSEKLKSPKWQKKRLKIMERDNFTCLFCGGTEHTLHVHHKEYIKGNEPWDYEDDNFQTLCEYCHCVATLFQNSEEKPSIHRVFKGKNSASNVIELVVCYSVLGLNESGISVFKYEIESKTIVDGTFFYPKDMLIEYLKFL